MKNSDRAQAYITGLGVTSASGQGVNEFFSALMQGRTRFGVMQRPGRQHESSRFLGAEIPSLQLPESIAEGVLRTASFTAKAALATLSEAWTDAKLGAVDPERVGLVVGGSNTQQREISLLHRKYETRPHFLRPSYGMSFMDSDVCGVCSQVFGIQGPTFTVGGASASGQFAVLQAIQAVETGLVDVCIALGALMDLSYWECQGLRALGAMGSDRYADTPETACRPFDRDRDGFIFGESCGAVVIENAARPGRNQCTVYGRVTGRTAVSDGNRNPDPSLAGEVRVLREVLKQARLDPAEVDYVNPHATGSSLGDQTELNAIRECRLEHACMNATKSVIGHGLTAAGVVELVALLLQMNEGRIHPSLNLDNPMDDSFSWVRGEPVSKTVKNAINISLGFGGVNTAVCVQNTD